MKNNAAIFKSLSDETRLRILNLLRDGNELCVCDLMAGLDMPQSKISRHLGHLKNAGWLNSRSSGKWMYYSLREDLTHLHRSVLNAFIENVKSESSDTEDKQRLAIHITKKNGTCDS